jgi:hypothetical protein
MIDRVLRLGQLHKLRVQFLDLPVLLGSIVCVYRGAIVGRNSSITYIGSCFET